MVNQNVVDVAVFKVRLAEVAASLDWLQHMALTAEARFLAGMIGGAKLIVDACLEALKKKTDLS